MFVGGQSFRNLRSGQRQAGDASDGAQEIGRGAGAFDQRRRGAVAAGNDARPRITAFRDGA